MNTMLWVTGQPSSPWQSWSMGSKDLGYSATGTGAPMGSHSASPSWLLATMFATLATTAAITPPTTIGSVAGAGGSLNDLFGQLGVDAVTAVSQEGSLQQIGRQTAADVRSGSDLIAEIKATLGISITDLAAVVGVSRQAIYDWIGGGQVNDTNHERLMALRQVCLDWRSLTDRPLGRLLCARSVAGPSLLDQLAEDPLDRTLIQSSLQALAQSAAAEEARREAQRSRLEPLSDTDRYENTLTHVIPAAHS